MGEISTWGNDDQDARLKEIRQKLILDFETNEPQTWELPPKINYNKKKAKPKSQH